MTTNQTTKPYDVFILCGGLGSRLRSLIADRPKGLATVMGKTVLDILADDLVTQGFQRIIFCVGHLQEQIVGHFQSRNDIECIFSVESAPLGTGGALVHGLRHSQTDNFLAMNGDSFCDVDLKRLTIAHTSRHNSAATLAITAFNERDDVGNVLVDTLGRVVSFSEKSKQVAKQQTYTNAGVYALNRSALEMFPHSTPMSLEANYFPHLVRLGNCFAMEIAGRVVDIGTPERYVNANKIT